MVSHYFNDRQLETNIEPLSSLSVTLLVFRLSKSTVMPNGTAISSVRA